MDPEQFKQFLEMQQSMITTLVSQLALPHTKETSSNTNSDSKILSNVALIPPFDNFNQKSESFLNYKQRFENYLELKNISSNKDYCVRLLLNSIGPTTFKTLTSLIAPKNPSELTYDELVTQLVEHFVPKKNVLVAQHQFLSIYQTEHQSIHEFINNLRSNIGDCEFISTCECKSSVADIFLRTQFIRGLRGNSIREQLYSLPT